METGILLGRRGHGMGWRRLFGALLGVLLAFALGCDLLIQSPYRKGLPDTASDIREHRSGVVDFTYLLRVRITEEEFEDHVRRLGLILKSSGVLQAGKNVRARERHEGNPDWWSPIWSVDRVYGIRRDRDVISAKWEGGFVYLSVIHL